MESANNEERRSAPRRRVHYVVRFWNSNIEGSGFAMNISDSGLFVVARRLLRPDTRIHLEVMLEHGPYCTEAVVVRTQAAGSVHRRDREVGMGLRVLPWQQAVAAADPAEATAPTGQPQRHRPLERAHDSELVTIDATSPQRLRALCDGELLYGRLVVAPRGAPAPGHRLTVVLQLPAPYSRLHADGEIESVASDGTSATVQVSGIFAVRYRLETILKALEDGEVPVPSTAA